MATAEDLKKKTPGEATPASTPINAAQAATSSASDAGQSTGQATEQSPLAVLPAGYDPARQTQSQADSAQPASATSDWRQTLGTARSMANSGAGPVSTLGPQPAAQPARYTRPGMAQTVQNIFTEPSKPQPLGSGGQPSSPTTVTQTPASGFAGSLNAERLGVRPVLTGGPGADSKLPNASTPSPASTAASPPTAQGMASTLKNAGIDALQAAISAPGNAIGYQWPKTREALGILDQLKTPGQQAQPSTPAATDSAPSFWQQLGASAAPFDGADLFRPEDAAAPGSTTAPSRAPVSAADAAAHARSLKLLAAIQQKGGGIGTFDQKGESKIIDAEGNSTRMNPDGTPLGQRVFTVGTPGQDGYGKMIAHGTFPMTGQPTRTQAALGAAPVPGYSFQGSAEDAARFNRPVTSDLPKGGSAPGYSGPSPIDISQQAWLEHSGKAPAAGPQQPQYLGPESGLGWKTRLGLYKEQMGAYNHAMGQQNALDIEAMREAGAGRRALLNAKGVNDANDIARQRLGGELGLNAARIGSEQLNQQGQQMTLDAQRRLADVQQQYMVETDPVKRKELSRSMRALTGKGDGQWKVIQHQEPIDPNNPLLGMRSTPYLFNEDVGPASIAPGTPGQQGELALPPPEKLSKMGLIRDGVYNIAGHRAKWDGKTFVPP